MSKIAGPWDAANWAVANPILDTGEEGLETSRVTRSKIGDGVTPWNSLPYASGTQAGPNIVQLGHDFALIVNAGVPDATIGAGYGGKGSLCSDVTNGNLYVNGGTKTTPSWKLVTRAA
jgi:hypothetical protein